MSKSEDMNELKKEIKQKYAIVYELDWENDIDHEKSPCNEIKQTGGYWEFICEKAAENTGNDFEIICGGLAVKEGCWEGKLQEQPFYKDRAGGGKIFSAILPLDSRYDILNIDFKGSAAQRFKIFLYDDALYQLKKEVQAGVFDSEASASDQKRLEDLQNQFFTFSLEQKNTVAILSGKTVLENISFKYCCQDAVSFYFDYQAGKLNINNQNWRNIYDLDFDKLNYLEMYGSFGDDAAADDAFCIYKIAYAKNSGYIYWKPIPLTPGQYQVFLQYTGEPVLEYCSGNSANWELVPEKLRLTAKEDLRFRIKMNAGNRLYDLFIAKYK